MRWEWHKIIHSNQRQGLTITSACDLGRVSHLGLCLLHSIRDDSQGLALSNKLTHAPSSIIAFGTVNDSWVLARILRSAKRWNQEWENKSPTWCWPSSPLRLFHGFLVTTRYTFILLNLSITLRFASISIFWSVSGFHEDSHLSGIPSSLPLSSSSEAFTPCGPSDRAEIRTRVQGVRGSSSARVATCSLPEVHGEFVHHIVDEEVDGQEERHDDKREGRHQEEESGEVKKNQTHNMSAWRWLMRWCEMYAAHAEYETWATQMRVIKCGSTRKCDVWSVLTVRTRLLLVIIYNCHRVHAARLPHLNPDSVMWLMRKGRCHKSKDGSVHSSVWVSICEIEEDDRDTWFELQVSPFEHCLLAIHWWHPPFPFTLTFLSWLLTNNPANSVIPGFEVARPEHLIDMLLLVSPQSLKARRYFISIQFLVVHSRHSLKLFGTLQLHFVHTLKHSLEETHFPVRIESQSCVEILNVINLWANINKLHHKIPLLDSVHRSWKQFLSPPLFSNVFLSSLVFKTDSHFEVLKMIFLNVLTATSQYRLEMLLCPHCFTTLWLARTVFSHTTVLKLTLQHWKSPESENFPNNAWACDDGWQVMYEFFWPCAPIAELSHQLWESILTSAIGAYSRGPCGRSTLLRHALWIHGPWPYTSYDGLKSTLLEGTTKNLARCTPLLTQAPCTRLELVPRWMWLELVRCTPPLAQAPSILYGRAVLHKGSVANVDVTRQSRIDNYWNIDGPRDLFDSWTRFTQFTLSEKSDQTHEHMKMPAAHAKHETWAMQVRVIKCGSTRKCDVWNVLFTKSSSIVRKSSKHTETKSMCSIH